MSAMSEAGATPEVDAIAAASVEDGAEAAKDGPSREEWTTVLFSIGFVVLAAGCLVIQLFR